jgi:4-hydroxy-4-methyl-2-oxoglutarate aldolase
MPSDEEIKKTAAHNTESPRGLGSLTAQQLDALRSYDAPTVANAIETFNIRSHSEGFMRPDIRCIFPEMGVMVGYAVTALIRAAKSPSEEEPKVDTFDWWDLIQKTPAPRVIVMEDLDDPPAVGSAWGEVQANIHRALGCVGVVTNGGVRDLNEVGALGFHFFAPHVVVSHAYARMLDFGKPVQVGGLTVHTGDLIHADRHGVQVLPLEIATDIPRVADAIFTFEHRFIDYCKSQEFTSEGLKALWRQLVLHGAPNH